MSALRERLQVTAIATSASDGSEPRIRIRGAKQHNLRNVDVDIPRGRLTVVAGPSGAGKSSLALDTLYATGQRRYLVSLSAYARQFLEQLPKADVEQIDGLPPAVGAGATARNPHRRSTVGTASGAYDLLRVLFARAGRAHCPQCRREVQPDTAARAARSIEALAPKTPVAIGFEPPNGASAASFVSRGFARVWSQGRILRLDAAEGAGPDPIGGSDAVVVVDRLRVPSGASLKWRRRLLDSLGVCFREDRRAVVCLAKNEDGWRRFRFDDRRACPDHPDIVFPEPSPGLFSFNSAMGGCPSCAGYGSTLEYDPKLIVPDEELSLEDCAVRPWAGPKHRRIHRRLLDYAKERGVSAEAPWRTLPSDFRRAVIQGSGRYRGVLGFFKAREKKRYKRHVRIFLRRFQSARRCAACQGSRLRPEARWFRVDEADIGRAAAMSLTDFREWLRTLKLSGTRAQAARRLVPPLLDRIDALVDLNVGYLSLDRSARSLSDGEARRVSLASALGSGLSGALYVLDEPNRGLHPQDVRSLNRLLLKISQGGGTVVATSHDVSTIKAADHVIELGPKGGRRGGRLVFSGPPSKLKRADTPTGRALSAARGGGDERASDIAIDYGFLRLEGATLHNLRRVSARFPLRRFSCVTGVSGSGKSSLVGGVLSQALHRRVLGKDPPSAVSGDHEGGVFDILRNAKSLSDVRLVSKAPITRAWRSCPVTIIGAWDDVRAVFASERESRKAGLGKDAYSFNLKAGRCPDCRGAGRLEIDMGFMSKVHVTCESCGGRRFRPAVLGIRHRGKTIAEILEMTVDEAIRFFLNERRLGRLLWQLRQAGLGYLRLGQPANTLSSGEAQRLKIAKELLSDGAKRGGRAVYLMDEASVGLSGSEVPQLIRLVQKLASKGHTVIAVEHNPLMIRAADWVVDLGPGAGEKGGRVVAMGTPEAVRSHPESVTGRYL